MTFKLTVLCVLLLGGALSVNSASVCDQCMDKNYVKCLNTTSYRFCTGTPAALTEISGDYNCPTGQVCTDSANVCELESSLGANIISPCSGGLCATPVCTGAGEFHCTGPAKYVFCTSATTTVKQTCPTGKFCSEQLYTAVKKICASQDVLTTLDYKATCGSDPAPVVPTGLADKCWAAKDTAPGAVFFSIKNPDECTSYIYCEWTNNQLVGLLMNCQSGSRFDDTMKKCVTGTC